MGNRSANSSPLTRHWVRVSPSQLSNSITRELIHEHTLVYPNAQQLALALPQLQQRISRQHPHIPRVIYYTTQNEDCECGSLSAHTLLLYTEQPGVSLGQLQAGNKMKATLACCCTNLMSGLDYLQDFYGCFAVNQSMVFSNHKDANCLTSQSLKIWINSKIEQNERELPCSEKQMCDSVRALLLSLGENGQCRLWQHLPRLQEIDTLGELREEVKFIHSAGFFNKIKVGGHVRVDSASSPTNANFNTQSLKNLMNAEARSRPVSNSTNQMGNNKPNTPKSSQFQAITSTNLWERSSMPNEIMVRQTTNDASIAVVCPKYQTLQDLNHRPASTAKINFIYSRESTKDMSLDSILPYKQQQAPVKRLNFARKEEVPHIEAMPAVLQTHMGSIDSYNSSPRKQQEQALQIPSYPAYPDKETPTAKLATTTRSPLKADLDSQPHLKKIKLERLSSLHSSGSGKFEKYSQAIKEYEEKLKRRLTSSGNRKPKISLQTSGKKLDRMTLNKASEADFKETKSLYNDSQEDEDRQAARMPLRGQTEELARFQANIQRDKRLINEQMEDLMRFNNREEYRIIREKVKQKKQTFAELKAEATKLLEGFSF